MGIIIDFPADAASRRLGIDGAPLEGMGTLLILPVVRIEREGDETDGGSGPATLCASPGGGFCKVAANLSSVASIFRLYWTISQVKVKSARRPWKESPELPGRLAKTRK